MKPNTAAAFLLAGVVLWHLTRQDEATPSGGGDRLVAVASLLIVLLGAATLLEFVSGLDLGIDGLLKQDAAQPGEVAATGRMAPASAIGFTLLGPAFLLLQFRAYTFGQGVLVAIVTLFSFLMLVDLYDPTLSGYTAVLGPVGVYTESVFLMLATAGLLARHRSGFIRTATGAHLGARSLRRLLPLTALVMLTLGAVRVWGERLGEFEPAEGTAAMVVFAILLLAVGLWVEATQTGKLQASLQRSEENLAVTLHSIGDGVLATDDQGRVTRLNPVAEQLTGWTEAEARGLPVGEVFRILNERTRRPGVVPVDDVLSTGSVHGLANHSILVSRDGTERPVADSAAPIRDREGRLIGVVLVFRDVTIEREAERTLEQVNTELEALVRERTHELSRSEQRWADITQNAPDALIMLDGEARITYVNRRTEEMFGWSSPDLLGEHVHALIPPAGSAGSPDIPEEIRRTPHQLASREFGNLRAVRQNGSEFPVDISLGPVRAPEGLLVAVSVRDVTDRHRLEAQVRQGQRMEAMGQLAGGVAHDFNNLLTVINGYCELLDAHLPNEGSGRTALHEIEVAGQRAADLTRQLLAFGRRQMLEPEVISLNEVVREVVGLLDRVIGENIRVRTTLGDTPPIRIDPGQLHQVLLNLAVNARDAMPDGGDLMLQTTTVDVDAQYAAMIPALRSGPWVVLVVSDSGVGMDEATRTRAFDPFFTTKELGKGTGLGLATVHGIMAQSGGHVSVYSEVGIGTTFKLYFPIAPGQAVAAGPGRVGPAPRGNETILLVEDERAVRVVTRLALENLGYRVLEAKSGAEAIALAQRDERPIHLLLSDFVMPAMPGREVARQVAAIREGIKVVFMSGYTDDAAMREDVERAEVTFLQKPFTSHSLATKIRQALGG